MDSEINNKKIIVAGIDIGGTRTKTGLVYLPSGEIIQTSVFPTVTGNHLEFVESFYNSVNRLLTDNRITWDDLEGIGIGVPGYVDIDTGIVDSTFGFLSFMEDYPLKDIIQKRINLQCKINNDARLAALGEAFFGIGIGSERLLMITLGTGVGVGIVNKGRFLFKNPVEHLAGHIKINESGNNCYCGMSGCLESLVSATGIIKSMQKTALNKECSVQNIFKAAEHDDIQSKAIIEEFITNLAYGLNNYIFLFAPDTIVLGGGVSLSLNPYLKDIKKKLNLKPFKEYKVELHLSMLKENAGILGAAALFL